MFSPSKLSDSMLGLFVGKARQWRVTAVSFATGRENVLLSSQVDAMVSTRARCIALAIALWIFGLLNAAGAAWALSGRLDIEPYVADGSVFGCQPTAVQEPAQ
jgi:hypothetical protein